MGPCCTRRSRTPGELRRVTLRARWVTLRVRWVTLRARWVTLRARWVTLRARWVTLRDSLADATSSLGDAESSLGDAESSLGPQVVSNFTSPRPALFLGASRGVWWQSQGSPAGLRLTRDAEEHTLTLYLNAPPGLALPGDPRWGPQAPEVDGGQSMYNLTVRSSSEWVVCFPAGA